MKVTLLGFGTVGMGLAQALAQKGEFLSALGARIDLVAVADSRSAASAPGGLDPSILVEKKRSTGRVGEAETTPIDLIRDVESDVVVELTPGNPKDGEPALSHIREALRHSRSVVSANKMPLAFHFAELTREAERRGLSLRYGACVGGGIPMLEMGRACAEAEEVDGFDAVLNSTSNFILTMMQDGGVGFEAALAEAQKRGYAEADPSLDIDGYDAAAKLVILADHVLKKELTLGDVHPLEGIRGLTVERMREAAGRGMAVRPLAVMGRGAQVGPREVGARSPLNVYGATNVAVFHCKDSRERAISGPSGGGVATSRAVLRDLISIAKQGRVS